ncbi:O-antigen ligase family protein [Amphritea atlantica]|nr:O-antigen ligase family protein [Amphritea atlantica]
MGDYDEYIMSQSNNYFQLFFFYVAFYSLLKRVDYYQVFSSPVFLLLCVSSVLVNIAFGRGGDGEFSPYMNFNTFLLFTSFFFFSNKASFRLRVCISVVWFLIAFSLSDRASFLLIVFLMILTTYITFTRFQMLCVIFFVICFPFFINYMDFSYLEKLYIIDQNSGIRGDFIRGAFDYLGDDFFWGVGFDEPYRSIDFDYIGHHEFLLKYENVMKISNHNSVVDMMVKMGFIWLLLFFRFFYYSKRYVDYKLVQCMFFVSLVGISFDAWFENQYQLPILIFVLALIGVNKENFGGFNGLPSNRTS